jgi:multidrug transporter EmrE-like cation transporter
LEVIFRGIVAAFVCSSYFFQDPLNVMDSLKLLLATCGVLWIPVQ